MPDLFTAGLNKLKIALPQEIIKKEIQFLDELLRWNKRINLTSICHRAEALEKHLLDSLVLLNHLPQEGRLLDMGSGGGFPGLPLAIAREGLQIVSVDSVGKKINFQKHIKRLLTLNNVQPICSRIEDLKSEEPFDFIVARALSDLPALIELSAPLLRDEGQLLVMKGPEGSAEIAACFDEKKEKRYQVTERNEYLLPESHSERHLYILTRTNTNHQESD